MRFRLSFLLAAAALVGLAGAAGAQNGFYLGADLGTGGTRPLESTRTNHGVSTNCDQWLASATLPDGTAVPLPLEQCAPQALPASPSRFTLGRAGLIGGAHAGYAYGRIRFEGEYLRRANTGEQLDLVVPGDPKQAEFTQRTEEIDNLRGDLFFANLVVDASGRSARFRPHFGAGFGAMWMEMEYAGVSVRTADREVLLSLGRNPNAAGLRSVGEATVRDRLWGWQALAGLDFAVTDRVALTARFRYLDAFGTFEAPGNSWDPLRGHESSVGPGGEAITYDIGAEGFGLWTATAGIRLFLN